MPVNGGRARIRPPIPEANREATMLVPDQPSDPQEGGAPLSRASSPGRRSRKGGVMVVVTAGLFVIVTLTVVWLWSSVEPACENAEVVVITPLCDGNPGQP